MKKIRAHRRHWPLLAAVGLMPTPLLAQACEAVRPDWDGQPMTALGEAVTLFASPGGVALLVLTALAIRFRSQWGGVAVVVLWTGFASLLTMLAPAARTAALVEGCVGPPTVFVGVVAVISAITIFLTAPKKDA